MSWDRAIGLIVVLLGLVIAGTYGRVRPEQATSTGLLDRPSAPMTGVEPPTRQVQVADRQKESSSAQTGPNEAEAVRASMRRALFEAVERARREPPAVGEANVDPAPIDAGGMPDMEMTWDQYRGWTKFSAALAHRDYKQVEGMFPAMQGLFGEPLASVMLDACVEDYRAFLFGVLEAGCDGYDPQSVWRKTLFMSFALARLNRSSASLDRSANDARELCGYEG
jgi:hypothetical protein